jgi:hypothetical protein
MTPAEKRVKELIDRWLTSLELHLQYVDLKDSAYNNVQPWPVHDRPTRWVLEVAKQKTLELQTSFQSRLDMGDAKFAEAVELIVFLANLVGLQHVQRFVPLADPEKHGVGTLTELDGLKAIKPAQSAAVPKPAPPPAAPPAAPAPPVAKAPAPDNDATREMPRPIRAPAPPAAQPAPAKPAAPVSEKLAPDKPADKPAAGGMEQLVIEDAVRLTNWGRSWHELAESIARIADRPKAPEVRKMLRSHRAEIERRVAADKEAAENGKPDKKDKKK